MNIVLPLICLMCLPRPQTVPLSQYIVYSHQHLFPVGIIARSTMPTFHERNMIFHNAALDLWHCQLIETSPVT
jgi:hypothetical protein